MLQVNLVQMVMLCYIVYLTILQAKDMKLKTIQELKSHFNVPIGLSDHTIGSTVAVAAITLGATIIEKHITLSRLDGGPDQLFHLNLMNSRNSYKIARIFSSKYKRSNNVSGTSKSNAIFRRSILL